MPVATCVVRLSEVSPAGVSALVSTGALNLTHRGSDTRPEPVAAEAPDEVAILLRATGYRFSTGHRIRVTVLTSYWPVLWPSPFPGELRVHRGGDMPSRLELPVLPDEAPTLQPPDMGPPRSELRVVGSGEEDPPAWRIEEDVLAGTVTVTIGEGGTSVQEDGSRLHVAERLELSASDPDPAHTRLSTEVVYRWSTPDADAAIRATAEVTSDAAAFDVAIDLDVQLDGEPFFGRSWRERVPRRLV